MIDSHPLEKSVAARDRASVAAQGDAARSDEGESWADAAAKRSSERGRESGLVLYVGNFITPQIKESRRLNSHNPAGSNRMERIATALRTARIRAVIVSPAATMRMGLCHRLWHKGCVCRTAALPIVLAPTLAMPLAGMMLSPWAQLWTILRLVRTHKVDAIIAYNFNPSMVLLAFFARLLKIPLLNNIEDVATTRWRDFLPRSSARPVQQVVFSVCMHLVAVLSRGIIIPSKKFLRHVGRDKPWLLVTGCVETPLKRPASAESKPLRVLFAGKLEPEHGSDCVAELIQRIDSNSPSFGLEIHVSGAGAGAERLKAVTESCRQVKAAFHGFVARNEFQRLLEAADVCLVLQRPDGRYATYKTPSKAYEYLAYGKVVLGTAVGDLAETGTDAMVIVPLEATAVLEKLQALLSDRPRLAELQRAAREHAERHFAYNVVGARLAEFVREQCNQR